ncbi:MAG: indolepyruvate ferredoxin oxidoreductase subunit alpha [Christensenellales bacterium]|jgi:indolepyruvate ferredoxin oxidoreductase alpha subunit
MTQKELMLANFALARGAYEAGVKVASAYPGTPSTEITESIAQYKEIYSEWSPNEKVALEVAAGASIAGVRALCSMKHVGLNVAADPLFTASYTGVNGGLVLAVADDPGMHSSQNEQDSRYYGLSAHVPVLEPCNAQECKDFTVLAFDLSEKYDTPIIVRLTTRVAHSQSEVTLQERREKADKEYKKDIAKYAMMPAQAKLRHIEVEKRMSALLRDCNDLTINKIEYNDSKLGVICSGAVYNYVKEVLPSASIFKLGMVHPLPYGRIAEFASRVSEVLVIEELEPFIENSLKAKGIACHGKEIFGVQGEITAAVIKEKLLDIPRAKADTSLPMRPPVMCPGCSHRGVFYVLNKLKLTVTGDIGCYTLGALAPLSALDTCVCMGASIGMAHGFDKAKQGVSKKTVAVIGDSTFVHSGITGLINSVYNKGASTVIIMDNSITGMTGHQQHPGTGVTLKGEATHKLDLVKLCEAIGVKNIRVVDAYDILSLEKTLKEELEKEEVSVIIAQKSCVLIRRQKLRPYKIIAENCRYCKACLRIGCPAIENHKTTVKINRALCTGCGVCAQLCKFGAIAAEDSNEY